MAYLLVVIGVYCLSTFCFFYVFNGRRDRNDPEDTARECFITALFWPVVEIFIGIITVVEFYYGQKDKYELWRWRVRQEKKRKDQCD